MIGGLTWHDRRVVDLKTTTATGRADQKQIMLAGYRPAFKQDPGSHERP